MRHTVSSPPDDDTADEPGGKPGRHRVVRWAAVLGLVVGVFMVMQTLPIQHAMDRVVGWIEGLGYVGAAMYVLIYILAAVLMLPGWPFTLAAGVIFGFVQGTLLALTGSTLGAAVAMLVARYVARDKVARLARQYPRFGAMDRAVSRGGWRIVALLRMSPGMPYNLQNYFYGLTSIRFWPCIVTTAFAMLPGTAMFVYVGFLGFESLQLAVEADPAARLGGFALLAMGLAALVVLIIYLTRLAHRALREQAAALDADPLPETDDEAEPAAGPAPILLTGGLVVAAALALTVGVVAQLNRSLIIRTVTELLGST